MLRTRVGYAGGDRENPTYRSMGDHTEAISIDFDPTVISYDRLLELFWDGHRCQSAGRSRQYMNAVFYHNEQQKAAALESMRKKAGVLGISTDDIGTKILPVKSFTYAEGYHQKYSLRGKYRAFLEETYPETKAFADSAVGARLISFLGSGAEKDWEMFLQELPSYGLPEKLESQLRAKAEKMTR